MKIQSKHDAITGFLRLTLILLSFGISIVMISLCCDSAMKNPHVGGWAWAAGGFFALIAWMVADLAIQNTITTITDKKKGGSDEV
jgi:uncharacterized BrkB/YihY/UPF0761 family membrane protein